MGGRLHKLIHTLVHSFPDQGESHSNLMYTIRLWILILRPWLDEAVGGLGIRVSLFYCVADINCLVTLNFLPRKAEDAYQLLDFGLNYGTCFGQWDICRCYISLKYLHNESCPVVLLPLSWDELPLESCFSLSLGSTMNTPGTAPANHRPAVWIRATPQTCERKKCLLLCTTEILRLCW